jgi:hypothetical protein
VAKSLLHTRAAQNVVSSSLIPITISGNLSMSGSTVSSMEHTEKFHPLAAVEETAVPNGHLLQGLELGELFMLDHPKIEA